MSLATIGVYGFTADGFVAALREANVRLLLDLRRRRGVRGALYPWANARRLQALLQENGIAYRHHLELAPTDELRRLLHREGVPQRSRTFLTPEYVERYVREILDPADLDTVAEELRTLGPGVLLCVEARPEACHRSLVAARLSERQGFEVTHLLAPEADAPGRP